MANVKRYQYRILDRGGVRYLLPCSCSNINGEVYLYYDVSSTQNIRQIFADKKIQREWMRAFLWSMQKVRQELTRFLLDEKNIVWNPEHIFQDLEKNDFLYMYMPYAGQEGDLDEGFEKILEFWTEKVDYNDSGLSGFVYQAYEKFIHVGQNYLEKQIFEDFKKMEAGETSGLRKGERGVGQEGKEDTNVSGGALRSVRMEHKEHLSDAGEDMDKHSIGKEDTKCNDPEKKKIRPFWDTRKRKQEQKNIYREEMYKMMNGYAVCEESEYGEMTEVPEKVSAQTEEFGKTIYIEEKEEEFRGLYTEKGLLKVRLDKYPFVLGKRKEESDYVLEDYSVSRIHAKFTEEVDGVWLEDLNSTNGTFKNGLRMQPYEKRRLEQGDVLRFGKSTFVFK